jgi:hypothetical protein
MTSHNHTMSHNAAAPPATGHEAEGAAVMTEAEAARSLRLSVRSLQRYRIVGGGPVYLRLGERRIGYRRADLDAWINSRRVTSTSAATVARERAA